VEKEGEPHRGAVNFGDDDLRDLSRSEQGAAQRFRVGRHFMDSRS